MIADFFTDLDTQWKGKQVRLSIIGCGALLLQANYSRGTKDSDIFETTELDASTQRHLIEVAGFGTKLHSRRAMYIDIVKNGVPFLPHVPEWHALPAINARLTKLELRVLGIVDVVVSKLKRYNPDDQSDIEAMIDRGLVSHQRLVSRFVAAVDEFSGDARAADLPKYLSHLHRVERDMLGVPESEIELPDKY